MTVDPRLQLTPGEYLIHPDGSASRVVGKRNMTVDEILATRFYLDRAGRGWNAVTFWASATGLDTVQKWVGRLGTLSQEQMRLLIERDQHRDVCPGLQTCKEHPAPYVWIGVSGSLYHEPAWGFNDGYGHNTLPEAMDAARALAVGE